MTFEKINFLTSAANLGQCPEDLGSEIAFVGKSNAGKSTAINVITNRKNIAKTSKTPGRTQSVNIYEINKRLNIVDLPGYGYAKLSISLRNQLSNLLQYYLTQRKNLKIIYILIDCKVGIKNIDIDVFDVISNNNISFKVIVMRTNNRNIFV